MAVRHFWFVISLILAVASGYLAPNLVPLMGDGWLGRVLPPEYVSLLTEHATVRIATGLAVGGIVVFLLGFVVQAVVDAISHALAARALKESQNDIAGELLPRDFQALCKNYVALGRAAEEHARHLKQFPISDGESKQVHKRFVSARPARASFSRQAIADGILHLWFVDPLVYFLGGSGIVLFILGLVNALGDAAAGNVAALLQAGAVSLLILAAVTLLIVVIKQALLAARARQQLNLCRLIDQIYPPLGETERLSLLESFEKNGSATVAKAVSALSTDIGKTMDARLADWLKNTQESNKALRTELQAALAPTMQALAASHEKTGEAFAEQAQATLDAVLHQFLQGIDAHFAERMKHFGETLEDTQKTAEAMQEAYREALASHRAEVTEQLSAHAESFSQTAANFDSLQSAVDNLVTLAAPLMRQIINHQEALLAALQEETTASKVIGRAATELSTAAQASRETVEQFITLAEKLRETTRAVGTGSSSGGASASNDKRFVRELRALKQEFARSDET